MRDIGPTTTGMAAGVWNVFLCDCGHEIESSDEDDWVGEWPEKNPVKRGCGQGK